jgi:hypothetical protein
MTEIDVNDGAFLAEQYAIINKVKIELYRKYKQKVVFQLSSLEVEDIKSLQNQGIYLSPQEYIDLAP